MNFKEERKKDAEAKGGHIYELKRGGYIVDKSCKKPYVFISYSSKDWHKVLYEIIYDLCTQKGLRVYFDTQFDVGSDSWLKQFEDNMKDCKAVLAFVSPAYKTSYATLMELMCAREENKFAPKTVLPIYIGNADCLSYDNTGLGTRRFPDCRTNDLWDKELTKFNELFKNFMVYNDDEKAKIIYPKYDKKIKAYDSELDKKLVFNNKDYWKEKGISDDDIVSKEEHWKALSNDTKSEKGEIYLNKKNNAQLISMILSEIEMNAIDGVNKNIPDTICDKLKALGMEDVFDNDLVGIRKITSYDIEDGENKDSVQVNDGDYAQVQEIRTIDNEVSVIPVENALWEYKTKGACSILKWNGETTGANAAITVLKGSVAAMPSQNFQNSCKSAFTLKLNLEANGIIQNNTFTKDYTYNKVATVINLLNGGSVSTPAEVKSGHLRKLDNQMKIDETIKETRNITEYTDSINDDSVTVVTNGFEYTLWGISHTSNKLSDMMHDVFDLIAEKYPEKIPELAASDSVSSVARKDDVDGKKLPANKLNYFRVSREHNVAGTTYYVGTSYNRTQGTGQIERMLKICEGSAEGFIITSSPETMSHKGGNTGKKGIDELL